MEELEGSQIASGAAQKSLEFLRDTLQEALDLVTKCCSMGWMKALVKASACVLGKPYPPDARALSLPPCPAAVMPLGTSSLSYSFMKV